MSTPHECKTCKGTRMVAVVGSTTGAWVTCRDCGGSGVVWDVGIYPRRFTAEGLWGTDHTAELTS